MSCWGRGNRGRWGTPSGAGISCRGKGTHLNWDPSTCSSTARALGSGPGSGGGRDVAVNGKVIEQAQILTTHNLAALVNVGITLDWAAQARDAWKVTRHHLAKATGEKPLLHRKNAAYAWRQTVFYLALSPRDQVAVFVDDSSLFQGLTPEATAQTQRRFLKASRKLLRPAHRPRALFWDGSLARTANE